MTRRSMNRKYQLILADFDGTLVNSEVIMSNQTKSAIKQLVELGYKFSIATGRDYYGQIDNLTKELGIMTPIISRGGAEIIDPTSKDVLYGQYFEPQVTEQIKEFLLHEKVEFIAEHKDTIYSLNNSTYDFLGDAAKYKDISELPSQSVPKFLVFARLPEDRYIRFMQDLHNLALPISTFKIQNTNDNMLLGTDILPNKVSKKTSVSWLAQYLNIATSEIIGIGDSYNDIPLLEICGYKVAVDNGPKELLRMADLVVKGPDAGGLQELVERLKPE